MDALEDRVLFIDGEAIVIDKPAGLAVHPGPSTRDSLEDHLDDLRFGFRRPPSPVHRLDRDTSGCLLLARNAKAHKSFARAFDEGRVEKSYVAVLDGVPEADQGRIDLPLAKISSREAGWRMVPDPDGKPAVTEWRRLGERDGRALVLFTPRTGRTHQIRVHAAAGLRLPIAGDPVYGRSSPAFAGDVQVSRAPHGSALSGGQGDLSMDHAKQGGGALTGGRMLLHAIGLRVPRERKPDIDASAPLPPHFLEAGFADAGL